MRKRITAEYATGIDNVELTNDFTGRPHRRPSFLRGIQIIWDPALPVDMQTPHGLVVSLWRRMNRCVFRCTANTPQLLESRRTARIRTGSSAGRGYRLASSPNQSWSR